MIRFQSFWQGLKNYSELVAFQHTVFSLPFIFIAMITAADGWFGWELLLLGLVAATSARNFAMGVNRYADRKYDALNPRTQNRPNADGRLDATKMAAFILINGLLFIGAAYLINDLAFWMSFPILFVLGFYSYVKRFSPLAHLFLGVALGLAPIAGVVAVQAAIPVWALALSLGVLFWVAGFDLLYALQDTDFDKTQGLHSIPANYGEEAALFISRLFHGLTIIFWLFFALLTPSNWPVYAAIGVAAVMLAYEHHLVSQNRKNINKAFFTVNGYLGIVFLIFVILDKIVT